MKLVRTKVYKNDGCSRRSCKLSFALISPLCLFHFAPTIRTWVSENQEMTSDRFAGSAWSRRKSTFYLKKNVIYLTSFVETRCDNTCPWNNKLPFWSADRKKNSSWPKKIADDPRFTAKKRPTRFGVAQKTLKYSNDNLRLPSPLFLKVKFLVGKKGLTTVRIVGTIQNSKCKLGV